MRMRCGWRRCSLKPVMQAERVWLLMHIPVGINDYNTVKNEEAGSAPVEFWKPVYTREFLDLILKHKKTVQVVFAGHTHTWMISLLSHATGRHLS